jgi:hypothetical protein
LFFSKLQYFSNIYLPNNWKYGHIGSIGFLSQCEMFTNDFSKAKTNYNVNHLERGKIEAKIVLLRRPRSFMLHIYRISATNIPYKTAFIYLYNNVKKLFYRLFSFRNNKGPQKHSNHCVQSIKTCDYAQMVLGKPIMLAPGPMLMDYSCQKQTFLSGEEILLALY